MTERMSVDSEGSHLLPTPRTAEAMARLMLRGPVKGVFAFDGSTMTLNLAFRDQVLATNGNVITASSRDSLRVFSVGIRRFDTDKSLFAPLALATTYPGNYEGGGLTYEQQRAVSDFVNLVVDDVKRLLADGEATPPAEQTSSGPRLRLRLRSSEEVS